MKIQLFDKKGVGMWHENIKVCHVHTEAQDTVVSAIEHESYIQVRSPELLGINASKTIK